MATSNINDLSNISDIDLDQLIAASISRTNESLDLLIVCPWFTTHLNEIAASMAYQYRLDAIEIRDAVFDKLLDKIQTIKNPRNSPLTECLLAWCRKTARRVCLNRIRHNRVKKNYLECLAASEKIRGTRVSTEGVSRPLKPPDANSPEEIVLEKELAMLREKLRTDVYLEVKRELDNSSPTDIRVVKCWGSRMMNLKQISEETGIPISTVQRHLIAWQKRVLEKTVLHQIINKDPEHRAGAFEMIRNAVKKLTQAA